jgi:hypothetical protein
MKKTFALVTCLVFFFSVKAQSFELGVRYLAESNWFFNSNVTNSGGAPWSVEEDYSGAYSYSYGFHLAYNFNDHTGIETDVMFAKLQQSYNGAFGSTGILPEGGVFVDGETYTSSSSVGTIQIPVIFRFLAGNGAYFGLGPEADIVSNASYTASFKNNGPVPQTQSSPINTTNAYPSSYFCAVLSFGNNIRLSHSFFFNINLRFSYDITDMKGVDALGQDISNSVLYSGSHPFYSKYEATNAVSAAFGVGLLYRFGHDF